jgi:hypothetical protein
MARTSPTLAVLAGTLLLIPAAACTSMNMGTLADILASGGVYGGGSELSGEVRSLDTRRQEIEVQPGWGQSQWVGYDNRTVVVYRQREYEVYDLQRGDQIRIWLDQDRQGESYASRIELQQSPGDVGDPNDDRDLRRLEGTVRRVDTRNGSFELERRGNDEVLLVTLPYGANRSMNDRLRRLERGDRVEIEGYLLNTRRIELVRFL